MDYCSGGQLLNYVQNLGPLTESQTAFSMKQVLRAVLYLHNQSICHRDLTPENVLIRDTGALEKTYLKVTDFGVACHFKQGQILKARVGTPSYMSPQVIQKRYNERCDCWSAGVVMYFIFCGLLPFMGEDEEQCYQKILKGAFSFGSGWVDASQDAMDFVSGLP